MRPRATPALFALALLAASATPAHPARWTERSDRDLDAKGIRAVEVDNSRGDIEVAPSADGRIHLTAIKIVRARTSDEARRHAAEVGVTAEVRGDRWLVRATYPKRVDIRVNFWDVLAGRGDADDFGPIHQVRLQVRVPDVMSLGLRSVSGDLFSTGLKGTQGLSTTSGDCAVESAGGEIDVATVSGDARLAGAGRATVRTTSGDIVAELDGPLDARSVSGSVEVGEAGGELVLGSTSGDVEVGRALKGLRATTASGSIRVRRAAGAVELRSTSGDVEVDLEAPLAGAAVSSSSGGVRIGLRPGLDASLDLATGSGEIDCEVPVVLLDHGRNHMTARLGRGGAAVRGRTASGDLHVTGGGR